MVVDQVSLIGLTRKPQQVMLNGENVTWKYVVQAKQVHLAGLKLPLAHNWTVTWTY